MLDRDAAAVVDDAHRGIGADGDVDAGAAAGQGLVDGVVDHLVNEMVQTPMPGGPDVHARPLADGLQALEDLDVACVIQCSAKPSRPLLFTHSSGSRKAQHGHDVDAPGRLEEGPNCHCG